MRRIIVTSVYTQKEEFIHSLLHSFGVTFGIVAVPYLIWLSVQTGNAISLMSSCIYGFAFLMTFTFSMLYHGSRQSRLKFIIQLLDHVSIYFLIAGTYTPLIVTYMFNDKGKLLLTAVWLCAVAGIILKIFFTNKFQLFSVCLYLITGLLFLSVCKSFFASMPTNVMALIIAGSLLYLVGVIFYVRRRWRYHHAIWHSLTLIAGLCHFTAVVLSFR